VYVPTNALISIVGKGNHSAGHIQKIKPRVEQVCRELGLQYATEENAGRIYVNLTGGEAVMPPYQHHQQTQHSSHQQYPGHQQQTHHQQQQQPQQQDEFEQAVNALLPKVMRKLEKACCMVM
jgi:G3E family GTPase